MQQLYKYAQHFAKLELMKAKQEVFQNESGREGVDFIVKTKSGNYHELFLIPSNQLAKPNDYIFINNDQGERFQHLNNWEIKVFAKAIPELSKYALNNIVDQL